MIQTGLCRGGMSPTIKLDRDLYSGTIKSKNVSPDRMLPSETQPVKLVPSECLPRPCFGIGLIATQIACALSHLGRTCKPRVGPPPGRFAADLPLPGGGEFLWRSHRPTSASHLATTWSATPR